MTRFIIVAVAVAAVLILLGLAAAHWILQRDFDHAAALSPADTHSNAPASSEAHQGFLYGRVTTNDGATYVGRLRWGGREEAFWGDYFNGSKDENPWAAYVPPDQLKEPEQIEIFGVQIAQWDRQIDLGRPFMARFGDIARIEANGRDLRVTLKSGTLFHLDRFDADDFADGIRVWDDRRGVLDFEEWSIRSIELLSSAQHGTISDRLHGTVRTQRGDFSGFVQWNREACLGHDELDGHTATGEISLPFDTIRSIERSSPNSSLVTMHDGSEIALSDTGDVGRGNRGIYVDDRRYGRVLVSWDAFERVDFSPGGSGPAYGDFPPGRPLRGSVITLAGRRLTGRLVYDLDESETTETLDAPWQGVDYTIPFGLIFSVVPAGRKEGSGENARVILHSGEELQLLPSGDLDEGNAGMLVFIDGRDRPEYVPWSEVEQVELARPPAMYPPLGEPR